MHSSVGIVASGGCNPNSTRRSSVLGSEELGRPGFLLKHTCLTSTSTEVTKLSLWKLQFTLHEAGAKVRGQRTGSGVMGSTTYIAKAGAVLDGLAGSRLGWRT
ncbi:hypothetical protein R1flu_001072 [Riccia fluitans]|uniref:Uncharacterized protein n=1 Tax=Riccia fluitans TaxID=41844 RepID=A0ABD1Y5E8_9MARC